MNASVQLPVINVNNNLSRSAVDNLAVEEPLEIRVAYGSEIPQLVKNLAVTMRTPGNDDDLAVGFMFTEGIIPGYEAVKHTEYIFAGCLENKQNIMEVQLHQGIIPNLMQSERNFYTTSSCGVCGKASIEAIHTVIPHHVKRGLIVSIMPEILYGLPEKLIAHQKIFAETGGLHAAAIFDLQGELILVREDVGRHNALDKLIGSSLKSNRISLSDSILFLSGRASFELVQKAAMAHIPLIAAVGAPSSLAVSLAEKFGITLVGFLRNNRFNIYSSAGRINIPEYENSN